MCGICGEIDFNNGVRVESVCQMTSVLAHRGPDDEGMVFIKDGHAVEIKKPFESPLGRNGFEVGLGHRRLSIIDLSEAGHQPMKNEDGSIWIVFNGEIYNFQEIRVQLEKKGHVFKSRSDTEVILRAYEEWGVDCLKEFRGMFAFGLWDDSLKRLFLARDQLGKKPLVYFHRNGYFAFASEIKALLRLPTIEKKVSGYAIHDYLTYQYIPSPDTIFEGIKKLPPAHYLLYDHHKGIKIERYWRLPLNEKNLNYSDTEELQDRIRTELEESVKLRLISDVPLGAFLSGGIDSSLIVGIMAKLSCKPVKTFSIGFEEKNFDELDYARIVSNHFSTEHHEFIVKPDAIEILPKLAWHYNEPFADSSAIPTYYVAQMTKDYVKVVLTGDAGDENFAGYRRYLFSKWVALFTRVPDRVRTKLLPFLIRLLSSFHVKESRFNRLADFLEVSTRNQELNYLEQVKIFNWREKEGLYTEAFAKGLEGVDSFDYFFGKFMEVKTDDLVDKLLYLDLHTYLPEDLLVKIDIATMAHSIEARVPFLDHFFVEFVAGIPSHLKLKGTESKYILKKAFSDMIPETILNRKKMGFGVPVSRWFRKELKNYIYEILLDQRTLNRGYFKREKVRQLLDDHVALRYDHSARLWALLVLEIWFRVFMDEKEVGFTPTV